MKRNCETQKQTGSFLLVVMVAMLVMTFSGLLVMEMSIMGERTVSNEQRSIEMYHVAHTELESQLRFLETNPANFQSARTANLNLGIIEYPGGCGTVGQICQTVTLRYISTTTPPAAYSAGGFTAYAYELDSIATLEGDGARSSQTLGIIYLEK